MTKKKTYKTKTENIKVNEPLAAYGTKRIIFSTVETQNDIQLKYAMDITPIEGLQLMRKLNDYAFKNNSLKKF